MNIHQLESMARDKGIAEHGNVRVRFLNRNATRTTLPFSYTASRIVCPRDVAADCLRIYDEGIAAAMNGKNPSSNPYNAAEYRGAWDSGWEAGNDAAKASDPA